MHDGYRCSQFDRGWTRAAQDVADVLPARKVGPRFSVNNELRRFSPRDPGEPLDGVGQYLYPARFSTAPAPPGAKS